MASSRKKLIHIHSNVYKNGAPQAPTAGTLSKGEIAVNYNDTEPALFIENNSGTLVKFNAIQKSEIDQIASDVSNLDIDISSLKGEKIKINGTDVMLSGNTASIYAPTSSGTTNTVLVSDGANKSPKWVEQSTITAGNATQANKTVGTLTINGNGSELVTFDGSANTSVNITYSSVGAAAASHEHDASDLPKASSAATGIMKVGDFLTADTNSKVSVATGTSSTTVARGDHSHTLPTASTDSYGIVKAGGGLQITNGVIAANTGTTSGTVAAGNHSHTYSDVGAAPEVHTHTGSDIDKATTASTGVISVGNFLSVDGAGKLSVATGTSSTTVAKGDHTHDAATTSKLGMVTVGNFLDVTTAGTLSVKTGTTNSTVAVGNHTHTYSEVGAAAASHDHTADDLPTASTSNYGIVKIGTADGTVAAGNHTHSAYVNPTVTNVAPTLEWGETSTAATIGNTAITVTAMGLPTPSEIGAAPSSHTHTAADLPTASANGAGIVKVGNFLSAGTDGTISVATGTSNTTVARGSHTHNYAGSSSEGGAANSTKGKLTISTNGTTAATFNGSADTSINITYENVGAAQASHSHTSADLPKATTAGTGVMQVGDFLSVDTNSKVSVATGTSSTTVAKGDHTHNYAGSSSAGGAADSTKGTLTIKNNAGTTIAEFNGSASTAITLTPAAVGAAPADHTHDSSAIPVATTASTGVVKAGSFLNVDAEGTLSVATGTSSTTVARGNHTHNYAGSSSAGGAANSTKGTLTLKNNGGTTIAEFNGSDSTAITLNYETVGAAQASHSHTANDLPKATTANTGIMQVGSFLSVDANSKVSVATGTTNSTVAVGNHTHNYAGSSSEGGAANSTKGTLTLKNNGGTTIAEFNGSGNTSVTLTYETVGAAQVSHGHAGADVSAATTSSRGTVQVGNFLDVTTGGTLSVKTGNTSSTVAVGNHTHAVATTGSTGPIQVGNFLSVTSAGVLSVPTGTSNTTVAVGNHSHTPASIGAAPEGHTHTGADVSAATTSARGTVQVGSFLNVTTSGTLSVATGTSSSTVAKGDHTHKYAASDSAGGAANSTKGTLTISTNGTTAATFNGSSDASIDITYASVGAAQASHSHTAADLPKATTAGTGVVQVGSFLNVNTSGVISVATGTSNSTVAVGSHTHNYAGSASAGGAANSTKGTLTIKNNSGTTIAEFNGSSDTAITLSYSTVGAAQAGHSHEGADVSAATTNARGTVQVGSFLSVTTSGTLSVATGTSNSTVAVGNHTHAAATTGSTGLVSVGDFLSVTSAGKISVATGTSSTTVARGNHTHTASDVGAAPASHTHIIADLPTASTFTSDASKVPTQKQVKDYVDGLVASPVNYKGAITNGTLPTSSVTGDLYIVQTSAISLTASQSATGAAQQAEVGDYIIARSAGKWDVVQKNLTGAVTTNGTLTADKFVLGNGSQTVKASTYDATSFAPASHGHAGADVSAATTSARGTVQVGNFLSVTTDGTLSVSTGTSNSTVAVGNHTHAAATTASTGMVKVGSFIGVDANGTISAKTGTTSTTVARGDHSHSYSDVGAAPESHTHVGGDITSAVAEATNADKVDGYHLSVVTTMPASPDANTIYILK